VAAVTSMWSSARRDGGRSGMANSFLKVVAGELLRVY